MPYVFIRNLGQIEYTRSPLPPGIKGKTKIGKLDYPIFISEELLPGAKLDHVVAHEAGHRLTVEMALYAVSHHPRLLLPANSVSQTLTRYFIDSGLKEADTFVMHPEVKSKLHQIFEENKAGRFTGDLLAREFVAEVYAAWATGEGKTPRKLEKMFREVSDFAETEDIIPTAPYRTGVSTNQVSPVPVLPGWFDPRTLDRKGVISR